MDLELHGLCALVTGSSRGIGRAIAERLAAEGCRVVVHGRDHSTVDASVAAIAAAGGHASGLVGDLADPAGLEQVVDATASLGPDVLVANAGPFTEHSWDDVGSADWQASFEGNVVSSARLIRAAVPAMRSAGWGRVVTVGSRAVTTPLPNMVDYSAAKAAVVNLTVSLARHLSGTGVTANCVSPGVIATPGLEQMFLERSGDTGARWSEIEPTVVAEYAPNPSGRLGRPEDIADAVAFLASTRAGYVNGINLRVDGGITLTS